MKRAQQVSGNSSNKKSFYDISLSLIFSLCCVLLLFYSRLGHGHGHGYAYRNSYFDNVSSDHGNQMFLEANLSSNSNDSKILSQSSTDSKYSVQHERKGLEEVVREVLAQYAVLEYKDHLQGEQKICNPDEEKKNEKASHTAYLGLDEFRNKTMEEKGRNVPGQFGTITHRLEPEGTEYNYASASKGAKVLAHNKEAKGASNILDRDKDKYLRNPCSADEKFVVVELSEETLVDAIEMANFEHYSSNFKDIELLGSLIYPTDTWTSLGKFVAANVKHAQRFMLLEPKWVRYLRLNILSHYGSEFYCTLSSIEVYGVDAIERMLEDLIVVSEEPTADQSSNSNSTKTNSSRLEPSSTGKGEIVQDNGGADPPDKGVESNNTQRNLVPTNNVPNLMKEVRLQPNGRIPSDTVIKIMMQKVRSLEINLSVVEQYIREVNQRYSEAFPDLSKEISQNFLLLEQTRSQIKDFVDWKEVTDKGLTELETWKSMVSSQLDSLNKENAFLRLNVEKVLSDQASLEHKVLAVLAVSFSMACLAVLKLVLDSISMLFRACESEKMCKTRSGWLLILVSSSITTFIILLYN